MLASSLLCTIPSTTQALFRQSVSLPLPSYPQPGSTTRSSLSARPDCPLILLAFSSRLNSAFTRLSSTSSRLLARLPPHVASTWKTLFPRRSAARRRSKHRRNSPPRPRPRCTPHTTQIGRLARSRPVRSTSPNSTSSSSVSAIPGATGRISPPRYPRTTRCTAHAMQWQGCIVFSLFPGAAARRNVTDSGSGSDAFHVIL